MRGKVVLIEGCDLGRSHRGLQSLHIDVAITGHTDRERFGAAVGLVQHDDHVLQRVGGGPFSVVAWQVGVEMVDQRRNCGGTRSVDDRCWWCRCRGVGHGHDCRLDRFGVGGVAATGAPHEGVLANIDGSEKLLGRGSAHRAGRGRHDHKRQSKTFKSGDIRITMSLVRAREAVIVNIERVRVLHDELAST